MIIEFLAGALALGLMQQQTDTTFNVRSRGGLALDGYDGAVIVRTWDRPQMRVLATHSANIHIEIDQDDDGEVSVEAELRNGGPAMGVRFEITVPRVYNVSVDGVNIMTTVDGVQGNVAVENVEGAIIVRNTTGNVSVESIEGSVLIENVRGNVDASSVNQGLVLRAVRGDIAAEATNGSVVMGGIESNNVEISTINGLIEYDGTVADNGRYYLGTHNGQITMSISEQANATVTVTTHNGKVDSAFNIPVRSTRDGGIRFVVGNGSARIVLESHSGVIRLVRPRGR